MQQDLTAGKYKFMAGDVILPYIYGLHYNNKEWQRPSEFLPDRFDPESPLYLTPDGKKRNPYSWFGFSGGQRGCFGRGFAEACLKQISTYMSEYFDMEYVHPEYYKDHYPRAFAFQ